MKRLLIHIATGVLMLLFLISLPSIVDAQSTLHGGKGLLRVYSSETIGNGNFCIHVLGSYFRPRILETEEDTLQSRQAGDLRYGLTYGLGERLELFVSGSYLFEYQEGEREGSNHNLGDTQVGLKVAVPPMSFLQLGAVPFLRIDSGKDDEIIFRTDFTSNAIEYGFLATAAFILPDDIISPPFNVFLNGGIHMFSEPKGATTFNAEEKDAALFGIGLEFPSRYIDFFMELTTRQLYNRDDIDFSQNLFLLTPGIRVQMPKGISLLVATDFTVSRDPDDPGIHRPFPGWKIHLGLSASSVTRYKDLDDDGVPDHLDADPHHPEDIDGFEDDDGAPDYDNDSDGIPDGSDRAPNEPEDIDGFNDYDGIPDPDNDMDGILDVDDECMNESEDIDGDRDTDGCPDIFMDTDGDGIADELDSMPTVPEDFDGFEDDDGAPDYDNDNDRIPDARDRCPDNPETYNDYEDLDGCPDMNVSRVILDGIQFPSGSARIQSEFHPVLSDAADFLGRHPGLDVVIEGYTDNVGSREANIRLSLERAKAVRLYLIQEFAVEGSRLSVKGYGPDNPIADNATPEGRAKNRRIELYIPEWDSR
jgi:outer membrane protein OmpA-like peptidoglycan-associated protein